MSDGASVFDLFRRAISAKARSTILGISNAGSALIAMPFENVPILHWGFSIAPHSHVRARRCGR
jgi:hypothetical protein